MKAVTPEQASECERIAILLAKHYKRTITPDELDELHEWAGASKKRQSLFFELTDRRRVRKALKILKVK